MVKVHIDRPADLELPKPVYDVAGWVSRARSGRLDRLRFQIGGVPLLYTSVSRADVEQACPEHTVRGFILHLDLSYYMHSVRDNKVVVTVFADDAKPVEVPFQVCQGVVTLCRAAAGGL